jgi:pimeloyl-ACP methyl ester carboxylesterase
MRALRALGLMASAGALAWTATRRADRRAIHSDPAHASLQAGLGGQGLGIRSHDGTVLHAKEFGSRDAPTLVLVHGWTCALEFWTPQILALSADHRVIAYDLRGHGQSERPGSRDYSIDAHAADLNAVLEACASPGERCVVVGHSLGAMTILAWAHRHSTQLQERIAAAALLNTGVDDLISNSFVIRGPRRLDSVNQALGRAFLTAKTPLPGAPTPLTHRAIRYMALSKSASPAAVAFCERIVLGCNSDVRAACGGTLTQLDLRHAVDSLRVPTVVVAGQHDRLTPPVHARRLSRQLPHLIEEVVIPNAGHMTPVSNAGLVNDRIRRVVAAHANSSDGRNRD